jgi:hypothetical protein
MQGFFYVNTQTCQNAIKKINLRILSSAYEGSQYQFNTATQHAPHTAVLLLVRNRA